MTHFVYKTLKDALLVVLVRPLLFYFVDILEAWQLIMLDILTKFVKILHLALGSSVNSSIGTC